MKKRLVAKHPILYLSKQYDVGQEIPAGDPTMVKAWISAGTAKWEGDSESPSAPKTPKAKLATAEPGLAGESANGETDENLVGQVPKTEARSTDGAKKTGAKKSGA